MNVFYLHRLVSGAGDIKLTKDGNVLLHEMVSAAQTYIFEDILDCTKIIYAL